MKRTERNMAGLPAHYESLEVTVKATAPEIERAYQARAAALRASRVADAPEELAEVEAAYSILRDPAKRAKYDADVRKAEEKEDKKYAELDAQLQRRPHQHRKHVDGTSGLLDALWSILKFFG